MVTPTLQQANEYINSRYTLYDDFRVLWTSMPDTDKEVYINKSYDEFIKLHFVYDPQKELLVMALTENAIGIMDAEIEKHSDKQFKVMQSLGQAKNTKYNRREQGEIGIGLNQDTSKQVKIPITSYKAWDMIKVFTYGSRPIL